MLTAADYWSTYTGPRVDDGVPADVPKCRYIDLDASDERRWWPRTVWELLDYPGKRRVLGERLRAAIGPVTQNELVVLDLECGRDFASPFYRVAVNHGTVSREWDYYVLDMPEYRGSRSVYETLFASFIRETPGFVALDDFPHREDAERDYFNDYIEHPWFSEGQPVIVTCYLQHPGQDPAAVARSHNVTLKLGRRCTAIRDVAVYCTVTPRYEHGDGGYMTNDEWKVCMDRVAAHGARPILWARYRDAAAAEASRKFMENGGLKAIEAAGLLKPGAAGGIA